MQLYLIASGATNSFVAAWYVRAWWKTRRSRGPLFALFCAAVGMWSVLYVIWLSTHSPRLAQRWVALLLIPAGFIGPFYFHMAAKLVGKTAERFAVLGYAIAAVNAVCVLAGISVESVSPLFDIPFWPRGGPGFYVFLASYGTFLCGVGLMVVASLRSIGQRKEVLRIHSIVALAGSLIGFANLPGWFGIEYPPWSNALVGPFLAGASYTFAMLFPGHKRSPLAFSILTVLAAAAVLSMVTVLGISVVQGRTPGASAWVLLSAYYCAAMGACYFVFTRVHEFETRPWGMGNSPASAIAVALAEIERDLPSWNVGAAGRICDRIRRALDADGVAVYLSDGGRQLHLVGLSVAADADAPPSPAESAPAVLVDAAARGSIVRLKWLACDGADRWLASWTFAIPVIVDRDVVLIALIQVGRARYSNELLRDLHAAAFRLYVLLYTRRLAQQFSAQESLVRLGHLATGIAHEVRTPLTSVRTYVDLTHRGKLDSADEKLLYAEVDAGLDRMIGAIEAVMAYADHRTSERALVSLDSVLDQTRAMCATDLRRHNVVLASAVPAEATVHGNRRELLQVFANLIHNAIEALAPQRGGTIDIRYEAAPGGRSFRIKVADSGPGLPAQIQARLGQPFQTTKTQRHEGGRRSGYGLGLSIVADRMTAHGGSLEYRDGAFILTFPCAPATNGTTPPPAVPPA